MRPTLFIGVVATLLTAARTLAQPLSPAKRALSSMHSLAFNNSGVDLMAKVMELKILEFKEKLDDGSSFEYNEYSAEGPARCNGTIGEYQCKNINLMGHLRHQDMQSIIRAGNDIWGWTSPTGREFGLVGQKDGTAFVEVMPDGQLVYFGRLPTQTEASVWRDIKAIGHYAYVVSEATDHGLQVFDLRKLLTIDPAKPVTFDIPVDLTAHVDSFGQAHNVVANPQTNMIYVVGANDHCDFGGLYMFDVSDPVHPKDLGCGYDGYVHDAQCVVYTGPHKKYQDHEICFHYHEEHLGIVDVTQKDSPVQVSNTTYHGWRYSHQGWLATPDMTHLLLDDESDELLDQIMGGPAEDGHTRTYVVDITDLEHPNFTSVYRSPVVATDHNQYVNGTFAFQSNYGAGLRILDISSIREENAAAGFEEVGYFDCYPDDDEVGGETSWSSGAWSAYPFFSSGYVLVNCIERGVFSLKFDPKA